MDVIEKFSEIVRGRGLRVVFPEGTDPRILRAARRLKNAELAHPILLGPPDAMAGSAAEAKVDLSDVETLDPQTDERLTAFVDRYAEKRRLKTGVARRLVRRPLFFGGMMVAEGQADTMVGGVSATTASVIQAAALSVGLAENIGTPSSFFLMVVPQFEGEENRSFIFADCAVTIDPSADVLADIALASAASAAKLLSETPRVALLSFSTKGSAHHPEVEKVRCAVEIAKRKAPDLALDGELQADAALIARVAAKKVKTESAVAGKANVLVFPDLNTGNVAYKLTQYLAGARAIGPFLQGFAQPISDLSRGATVDDIVATTAISLAMR